MAELELHTPAGPTGSSLVVNRSYPSRLHYAEAADSDMQAADTVELGNAAALGPRLDAVICLAVFETHH